LPLHPHPLLHNINTDCPKQDAAGGGEWCRKGNNNLDTYSDQMHRITQVLPADSHAENKKM